MSASIKKQILFFLLFIVQVSGQKISVDSIKLHSQYLGSDNLEGRSTGSRGAYQAMKYLAKKLQSYRVSPAGDDNTYLQAIPMHGNIPMAASNLLIISHGDTSRLTLNEDYMLFKGGAQTFIPTPIPMVFVGYGIIAPEYDYNDYQSVDVDGKIVVFLSGEPESEDQNYFAGKKQTIYSHVDSKQRIAISRGARGSILILGPQEFKYDDWSYRQRQFLFEDVSLAYSVTGNLSLIVSPGIAEKLFAQEAYSLSGIYNMDHEGTMRSFDLSSSLSFKGVFKEREFIAHNVLGLNPGQTDSYIIVSAHFDHLGIGPAVRGDSIYNGFNDNALGVSVLLEIARVLNASMFELKRSVIFIFLTGEEKGLLGSTYYTDHPVVPLYKTVADINIDGISIFDQFRGLIAVGAELSSLEQILSRFLSQRDLKLCKDEKYLTWMPYSDQFAFTKAGIPSVLIQDGCDYVHLSREEAFQRMRAWQKTIYHSPFDDKNQPINYRAVEQHAQLLLDFVIYLANSNSDPVWKEGVPFNSIRLQTIAEKR